MQAERRALDAKQEFEQVSLLGKLRPEAVQIEQERIEDSKKGLEQLLDSLITRQKETVQAWEAFSNCC